MKVVGPGVGARPETLNHRGHRENTEDYFSQSLPSTMRFIPSRR
jgi:hypothetical protein